MRRVHDLVGSARPMPLSTSVMVNREELLELLDEAIERLPDELRAARWLLKEREEFLAKVRREGDDILAQARARAERMVQRTEVVKAAESRARKIVDAAESEARRLRNECEDYCDQKLASFEIVLERTLKMVAAGRSKLQGTANTGEVPAISGNEPAPEPDDPAFFDQDRLAQWRGRPSWSGIADLRRRPGTQRPISIAAPLAGAETSSARVPAGDDVVLEGVLEAIEGGRFTLLGTVTATWAGECRRCLEPVSGEVEAEVSEIFEVNPTDDEIYPDRRRRDRSRADGARHRAAGPAAGAALSGGLHRSGSRSVPHRHPAQDEIDEPTERPIDPRWAALGELDLGE